MTSACVPQVGLSESNKRIFGALGELVHGIPEEKKLFNGGNLNGYIWKYNSGY